jgi:hypothetical protein
MCISVGRPLLELTCGVEDRSEESDYAGNVRNDHPWGHRVVPGRGLHSTHSSSIANG